MILTNPKEENAKVMHTILPLITRILTDYTERTDRNSIHFFGEQTRFHELLKISVFSEISGYHLTL